jgi:ferredoxin
MATRVNPKLIDDLQVFGAEDVSKCYHCGNCSATCPFSKEPYIFPRRSMRFLQMGLEKKLEGSLEPWLCYYCGECSDECPREAEPGETMMSLRRWLTSRYDWTGISRLFYRSGKLELTIVLIAALLTGLGFVLWGVYQGGSINEYHGEGAFLPHESIHIFDWCLAGVLLFFLLSNCARMWWFTIGRDKSVRVPWWIYLKKAYLFPLHLVTQMRYSQCERKRPWVIHMFLVFSYLTMLILIMFFLGFMQSGYEIDWRVHVFGYIATVGLLGTTIFALQGRLRKSETHYKHSHETDWIFLALLIFVAFTGILQHILHRAELDIAANVAYVVHLMGIVPMLGLEVPFSKWAHLAYRPLAMYFADVRAEAMETAEAKSRVPATQTT